jgi:hypothetical protein
MTVRLDNSGGSTGQFFNQWDTPNDWNFVSAAGGILSNTTAAVTVKAAQGAASNVAQRNYITSFQIISTALGAATEFCIRDGAGGAVLYRHPVSAAGLTSGYSVTFDTPLRSSPGTLLEVVTLTASVTGSFAFNCQGYTGP